MEEFYNTVLAGLGFCTYSVKVSLQHLKWGDDWVLTFSFFSPQQANLL